MFGLGGGELFVIVLLAILLIGPKELPKVAKTIGRWYSQFKNAADEIKSSVEEEINTSDESTSPDKKPRYK